MQISSACRTRVIDARRGMAFCTAQRPLAVGLAGMRTCLTKSDVCGAKECEEANRRGGTHRPKYTALQRHHHLFIPLTAHLSWPLLPIISQSLTNFPHLLTHPLHSARACLAELAIMAYGRYFSVLVATFLVALAANGASVTAPPTGPEDTPDTAERHGRPPGLVAAAVTTVTAAQREEARDTAPSAVPADGGTDTGRRETNLMSFVVPIVVAAVLLLAVAYFVSSVARRIPFSFRITIRS